MSRDNNDLDVATATVGLNFYLPLWREILLAVGFIDASFGSILAAFNRKRSVCILAGGAAEALYAHPGKQDLVLNRRKGFVRLALMTGTPIVPVFAFGENDLYYQLPNPKGSLLRFVQEKALSYLKFAMPFLIGEG